MSNVWTTNRFSAITRNRITMDKIWKSISSNLDAGKRFNECVSSESAHTHARAWSQKNVHTIMMTTSTPSSSSRTTANGSRQWHQRHSIFSISFQFSIFIFFSGCVFALANFPYNSFGCGFLWDTSVRERSSQLRVYWILTSLLLRLCKKSKIGRRIHDECDSLF